ncbi:MAG: hypothetical protein ACK5LL_14350 [Suipraeoptans sp.]
MGSLILCHNKRAMHPYEVLRIHKKIYSVEELCYYLCNHLYLIDYTIMNHRLCNWIEAELDMSTLGDELRMILAKNGSVEQFVLSILKFSGIYNQSELNRIEVTLGHLKDSKEIEREKYKADTLFENGEYDTAILIYKSILNKEIDETVPKLFYGKVHANLGSCFGRLFLYKEAAKAYKEAYEITSDKGILRSYLYSSYRAYSEVEYMKLLSNNSEFFSMDKKIKASLNSLKKKANLDVNASNLEEWKKEYRKIDNK